MGYGHKMAIVGAAILAAVAAQAVSACEHKRSVRPAVETARKPPKLIDLDRLRVVEKRDWFPSLPSRRLILQ